MEVVNKLSVLEKRAFHLRETTPVVSERNLALCAAENRVTRIGAS